MYFVGNFIFMLCLIFVIILKVKYYKFYIINENIKKLERINNLSRIKIFNRRW